MSAKEPYVSAKEPCMSAKEPYIPAKQPCMFAKEEQRATLLRFCRRFLIPEVRAIHIRRRALYISAKEPCICAKEPYTSEPGSDMLCQFASAGALCHF